MAQLAFDLTAPEPRRRHGVRETSVETHRHLREVGHLDRRERRVLAMLDRFSEPPTTAEIEARSFVNPGHVENVLYVRRGMADLSKKGVVQTCGKRTCRVSGRTCVTWRARR